MPVTMTTAARLRNEACRCERLARGTSNPALTSCLLDWAAEYRRDARLLELRRPGGAGARNGPGAGAAA